MGSTPAGITKFADVAQLVERLPCKQRVTGSKPVVGSSYKVVMIRLILNLKILFTLGPKELLHALSLQKSINKSRQKLYNMGYITVSWTTDNYTHHSRLMRYREPAFYEKQLTDYLENMVGVV